MNELEVGVGFWNMQAMYSGPALHAALYREAIDEVTAAEELGFDSVWIGEHHQAYDGYCPSPLAVMAQWAAATKNVTISAGVLLLPLHTPARVAAAGAALSGLAPGRIRLVLGIGYRGPEFDAAGLSVRRRGRLLESHLQELRTTYADQMSEVDVWIGGTSDVAADRAARFGCSLFLTETATLAEVTAMALELRAAAGESQPRVGTLREVWLTENPADGETARRRLREMWHHYAVFFVPEGSENVEERRRRIVDKYLATAIIGGPDEVIAGLRRIVAAGVDTLALRVRFDGTSSGPLVRCLRRLARDVLPAIRS